jgi:hypothetical protein
VNNGTKRFMVRRTIPTNAKSPLISPRKSLPSRVEAALAVMQMGVSDYALIASTVGLECEDVAEIDHSEDCRIRDLAVRGVDPAKRFHLVRPLRCPKCRNRITVAPCITCHSVD